MEETWNTDARVIRICKVSYERFELNKLLGIPRTRCEGNIKMRIKETVYEGRTVHIRLMYRCSGSVRKHDNESYVSLNTRIFLLNERKLTYKVSWFILVFREAR